MTNKCTCGRSPTGNCMGWHKLSEEDFKNINYWPTVTTKKKFEQISLDENGHYYFSKGEQCMYSSSPCTYYKPKKLAHKNFYNYKIYWIND